MVKFYNLMHLAFSMAFCLASCNFPALQSPKETATPIPEQAVTAMPEQPALGIAGDDSIGDPYMPAIGNTGYDVEQYDLALAFSSNLDTITATVAITATSRLDNLGRISLDFMGYQTDSIYVGGKSAVFYRSKEKIYIDLPKTVDQNEVLILQVKYHGRVLPQASAYLPFALGLRQPMGKHTSAFAEPDGARAWFPCNDHPLDKAAFRVKATVPAGLTAISNGTLSGTHQAGSFTTFVWENHEPMATYLLTLAVGKYRRIDSPPVGKVEIRHYVFEDNARASRILEVTDEIVRFYSDLVGPYPFQALGFVEVYAPSLGMETQTMIMLDSAILLGEGAEATMAHEIVHHWFGDSLSPASWKDIWLNEGFATYFEILWTARNGDPKHDLGRVEQYLLQDRAANRDSLTNPTPGNMFGINSYWKGAWVLSMLHQELGDDLFFSIVRTYYQRFAYRNVSTADFQAVVEELSGKDMDGFFKQWVNSPGNPLLSLSWVDEGNEVSLQVCQLQEGALFDVPLEIVFLGEDGQTFQEVLQIDERQEQVTFAIPFDPTRLEVDPGQKILAEAQAGQVEALTGCGR